MKTATKSKAKPAVVHERVPPTTTEHVIWTFGYRPFVMGGRVNYILGCKVQCTGPHELGQGYKGYAAASPEGTVYIAEATTGAIVGSGPTEMRALEKVRHHVETGDPTIMRDQVKEAVGQAKEVEVHPADFFWGAMRRAR